MRPALSHFMQATLPLHQPAIFATKTKAKTVELPTASCASDEIHSYLGVRDLMLSEAETVPNEANLHHAWMANEFAEKCLRPVRSPYEAQSLPEAEATRERGRCKAVKVRIAELRSRLGAWHTARRHAA